MASAPPNHFSLAEWMAFVRHTLNPELEASLRHHLEHDQCPQCQATVAQLKEAYAAARALEAFNPPASTLARAQSLFQPAPNAAWWSFPARVAEALADAWPTPALAAGWRHVEAEPAQIYRAGSLLFRLKKDVTTNGGLVVLGTLAEEKLETRPIADCPMYAVSGKRVLAETRTNRFGEFLMEFPPAGRLRLVAVLPEATERIEIDLDARPHPGSA
ncbi:MAG: hypothetical protein NW208_04805 [Bryobacter sp.]|nr:hypothetical protein [Bryobacter sp.]